MGVGEMEQTSPPQGCEGTNVVTRELVGMQACFAQGDIFLMRTVECHVSQAEKYGYDKNGKLRDTDLRETLLWEFESGKEEYTLFRSSGASKLFTNSMRAHDF